MFLAVVMAAIVGVVGGGLPAALAQPTDGAGYRDFSFGTSTSVNYPTAEKPQSKLWFNDGTWWGSLFDDGTKDYFIYRFDKQSQSWERTLTRLDPRPASKADTLWDEQNQKLYVASAVSGANTTDQNAYVWRYSYSKATKQYTVDAGFPTVVASGPMPAIVLDKDTTGKLWVTFTQGGKVYMNRSLATDAVWGTPFVLPVAGTTVQSGAQAGTQQDISSVVASGSQITVMWSNQLDNKFYFAAHNNGDPDETWQPSREINAGPKTADEHLNLKFNMQAGVDGKVYAAVKTSNDEVGPADETLPLLYLVEINKDETYKTHVFSRVRENQSRPIVMLDQENRQIYMFATDSINPGGSIYYKKTSMDNISFQEGEGTPFIKSSADPTINDATSTKQPVTSESGILILASDNTSDYYLHNTIDLLPGDTTAPTVGAVAPGSGATGVNVATNVEATFSEAMDETTLTNTTFTLAKQGTTTPVAAAVTYDSAGKKAILNPNADLEPSATYTATVRGGSTGAKDAAGNPLAQDKVWSFTTAAGTPPPPPPPPPPPADTVAPSGSIKINGGAARTTSTRVRLALRATDSGSGVARMRIKNAGKAWSAWTTYKPSRYWRLTGRAGVKRVYVQYQDRAGNVSTAKRDSIRYAPRR